ncbi:MAG TPA: NADPH-dependent FMN reductase [Devosiaceae bacterium]|jgi:NAD(P)H-dependent FMN reductase|nr:NADPH-dependent FMN reductase [Devosiaceae bacterium]
MRLLTISGSLRTASSNTALLEAVARLAPPGVEIVSYLGLGELPHFNPDLEAAGPPPSVLALRAEVGAADGVLFSSPEYAHGIAGSFKNGLDWLVGSLEFPGKPVAILNAAPRASHADAQMREILRTMSARLIEPAMLTLPIQGSRLDAAGIAARPDLAEPIRAMLRSFVEAIREAQSAVA